MIARSHVPTAEQSAKYEASLVRLEAIRNDYIRRKPLYLKGFVGLTLAGIACFAFGSFAGVWGSMCATFISVTGYVMVDVRIAELALEIDTLRREIVRMRPNQGAQSLATHAGPYAESRTTPRAR